MTFLNTATLICDYNPIAAGVAERAVSGLVGEDSRQMIKTRLLRLQHRLNQKSVAKKNQAVQQLRENVRGGELFDFTFSGWVRNLVSSVAETENTMTNLINKNGPELVTIYNTVAKLLGEKEVNRFATKSAAVDRTARLLAMLNGKRHDIYEKTLAELGLAEAPKAASRTTVELLNAKERAEAPVLVQAAPKASTTVLERAEVGTGKSVIETTKVAEAIIKDAAPVKATKDDGIDAVEDKAHKAAMTAPKAAAPVTPAVKPAASQSTGAGKKLPGRARDFNFKPFSVHRVPREGSYLSEGLSILSGSGCQFQDILNLVKDLDAKLNRGNPDSVDRRAYELIRDLHNLNGYGIHHDLSTGVIRAYTAAKA